MCSVQVLIRRRGVFLTYAKCMLDFPIYVGFITKNNIYSIYKKISDTLEFQTKIQWTRVNITNGLTKFGYQMFLSSYFILPSIHKVHLIFERYLLTILYNKNTLTIV